VLAEQLRSSLRAGRGFRPRSRPAAGYLLRNAARYLPLPACGERGCCPGRCREDRIPNSLDIFQHFVVPETKNAVAMLRQPPVARGVLFVSGMLSAINFDHELFFSTDKIGDKRPDRLLAHKLQSCQRAGTQAAPKLLFSTSRMFAQSPRQPRLRYVSATHASKPPHPSPLPASGEREYHPVLTHGLTSPRSIWSKPEPRSIIGGALLRAALMSRRKAAVASTSTVNESPAASGVSTTP